MFKIILLILPLLNCVLSKTRYDNFTVYKILPENIEQTKLLQNLLDTDFKYDFWSDPVPGAKSVDVMARPEHKSDLESFLSKNGIKVEVTTSNLQENIDAETVNKYVKNDLTSMTWDGYYDLEDIYDWMDDLVAAYPTVLSEVIGGHTYEGRAIKGVKISHGSGRRVIFLEGGIHSREWISPSAVCFILNELLTSSDTETVAAARDYDWYIFPVTNPDGYVWTHLPDGYRLWRKNRRPFGNEIGVDLNRNWNNNWLLKGASTNPRSDTYAGPGPFSEPETRSLSEFIRTIGDQIDMYLSFHSYSQLLMLPFGNTTEPLANYDDAMNIGRRAMGALSVRYGTTYVTGNIAEAIYEATGGSVDWVKEHLKVPLVYCYELRDTGRFMFNLPSSQILPNNLETMDSLLELIHQAKRFEYLNGGASCLKTSLIIMIASILTAYFW